MHGKIRRNLIRRASLLCLALLFALPIAPAKGAEDYRTPETDAFFSKMFIESECIGGAVLISQGGQRIYDYFYGWCDKGKTRPVEEATVYKVASVTKLITAIGVMQLVEEGKLTLDDPLPAGSWGRIVNPHHPSSPVTLRQVMSHTSSLAADALYAIVPRWSQMDGDTAYFAKWAPGSCYEYSNLNGGILGSLIERASGQSLNDYMAEHVFSPLGINAAYAASLLPDASSLSNTFSADGTIYMSAAKYLKGDADYENTCDPDRHFRAAVGSLYISLDGLEKLGTVLACGGEAEGVRLLSPETTLMMRLDQSIYPGSSVTCDSPYGLGVYRHQMVGDMWYGHQGRWEGLLVDVFYEPETKTVLVLALNGVKRKNAGEIAVQARDALDFIAPWTYYVVDDE